MISRALGLALPLLALPLGSAPRPAAPPVAKAAVEPVLLGSLDVGSNGSHGAFPPVGAPDDYVIDLNQEGTYDPVHWRVVFHFTSVDIPEGMTVRFLNHDSRAPVVFLAQTSIQVAGTIDLRGAAGTPGSSPLNYADPGPGGGRGGVAQPAGQDEWMSSSGFGPGGGFQYQGPISGGAFSGGGGGGHKNIGGTTGHGQIGPGGAYFGTDEHVQLLGGSGGAAGRASSSQHIPRGGGGGGGAILLAANESIQLHSTAAIFANGGSGSWSNYNSGGCGAGGSIRIVTDQLTIDESAIVEALPGISSWPLAPGSVGRIRYEANQFDVDAVSSPAFVQSAPGPVAPAATTPTVTILSIDGQSLPADPMASLGLGTRPADMELLSGTGSAIVVETTYVPLDSLIWLRVTRARGESQWVVVTDGVTNPLVEVNPGAPDLRARTTLVRDLDEGFSALQALVEFPTP